MTLKDFFEEFKYKSSYITDLSIRHILTKKFNLDQEISIKQIEKILKDYNSYIIYLNDFRGIIYKQYESDIDTIYKECMKILNDTYDNQSYCEYYVSKILSKLQAKKNIKNIDILNTLNENIKNDFNTLQKLSYFKQNQEQFKTLLEELKND